MDCIVLDEWIMDEGSHVRPILVRAFCFIALLLALVNALLLLPSLFVFLVFLVVVIVVVVVVVVVVLFFLWRRFGLKSDTT